MHPRPRSLLLALLGLEELQAAPTANPGSEGGFRRLSSSNSSSGCWKGSKSAKSCSELGWVEVYGDSPSSSPTVCASSDDLGGTSSWSTSCPSGTSCRGRSNACSGLLNFQDAQNLCSNAGARPCTINEIENNEAADTGCCYDCELIWSSTGCGTNGGTTN